MVYTIQEHNWAHLSPGENNRKTRASMKLLEKLGLPTFSSDDNPTHHNPTSKQVSYWNAFYLFAVIGMTVGYTFMIILIPQSNHFENPQSWYQLAFILPFMFPTILTLDAILLGYYFFADESIISLSTFFRLYIPCAFVFTSHTVL